ncbi:MAG: hypothetical protein E7599_00460 [Ruminococcaceae bacterium]|nr:hypothetical protein [Oscillospiraceae bacterium]
MKNEECRIAEDFSQAKSLRFIQFVGRGAPPLSSLVTAAATPRAVYRDFVLVILGAASRFGYAVLCSVWLTYIETAGALHKKRRTNRFSF